MGLCERGGLFRVASDDGEVWCRWREDVGGEWLTEYSGCVIAAVWDAGDGGTAGPGAGLVLRSWKTKLLRARDDAFPSSFTLPSMRDDVSSRWDREIVLEIVPT